MKIQIDLDELNRIFRHYMSLPNPLDAKIISMEKNKVVVRISVDIKLVPNMKVSIYNIGLNENTFTADFKINGPLKLLLKYIPHLPTDIIDIQNSRISLLLDKTIFSNIEHLEITTNNDLLYIDFDFV